MLYIDTATSADIPQLVPLINAAYRGDASRKGWTTEADFLQGDLRTDAENLGALLARETAVVLKCSDGTGQMAGCVFLDKHADRLYLGMLTVDPDRQAQGIGKQLMAASEDHARRVGCHSIYMRVLSKRPELIAWYERHGYGQTGETQPYDAPIRFGIPTEPLVFLIMEKHLTG